MKVSDGALSTQTSFVLTITAVNDAPVAKRTQGPRPRTPQSFCGLPNDESRRPATTTRCSSHDHRQPTAPRAGRLPVSDRGKVRYLPKANYSGTDQFTYKVCDNGTPVRCTNQVVRVTVTPVNDAPTISSISNKTTRRNIPVTVSVHRRGRRQPRRFAYGLSVVHEYHRRSRRQPRVRWFRRQSHPQNHPRTRPRRDQHHHRHRVRRIAHREPDLLAHRHDMTGNRYMQFRFHGNCTFVPSRPLFRVRVRGCMTLPDGRLGAAALGGEAV